MYVCMYVCMYVSVCVCIVSMYMTHPLSADWRAPVPARCGSEPAGSREEAGPPPRDHGEDCRARRGRLQLHCHQRAAPNLEGAPCGLQHYQEDEDAMWRGQCRQRSRGNTVHQPVNRR
jgi:hypothetical protein